MEKSYFVFFALFCGVLGKDCSKVDQCSCKFDDGTVVDITSLGNQDNSPRYTIDKRARAVSLISLWIAKDPTLDGEHSDQDSGLCRLIRVFASCTLSMVGLAKTMYSAAKRKISQHKSSACTLKYHVLCNKQGNTLIESACRVFQ